MYTSVHHYSVDAERVDEFMHRVDEKLAPRLEKLPGFLAYQAIDAGVDRAGEGTVFAVTICSDRGAADRFAGIASEFVRDELGENGGRASGSGHRSGQREPAEHHPGRAVAGCADPSSTSSRSPTSRSWTRGMTQGKLRLDLVAVPPAMSLAQHVALFDQLGQDPVGGALGDPDRGGDVGGFPGHEPRT